MGKLFKLNIVTPGVNMFNDEVELVVVKTVEGDMGIMAGHELTVAPLAIGAIKLKTGENYKVAASSGGFLSVEKDEVTIITDAAEWADDIDENRAKESQQRAETRLSKADKDESIVVDRAKMSLHRALNRIRIKNEYGK